MHELSITQSLVSICLKQAKENNAKSISKVIIKVGELTGLVPEYIVNYFNVVAKDTIAENSQVIIKKVPVAISCNKCGFEGELGGQAYNCPKCNGNNYKIINGREFYVDSIEIEE